MKESFREREKERLDGQHEISDMLYYTTKEHRTYLASTVIGNSCFTMSRLEWPAISTYQLYILNNRLKSSMNYIYVRIHRLGNQFINHTTFLVSVILISPLLVLNTLLGIQWQHMGHFIHVLQVIQMCFFVCLYVCAIHIICNAKALVFMCVCDVSSSWIYFLLSIFTSRQFVMYRVYI